MIDKFIVYSIVIFNKDRIQNLVLTKNILFLRKQIKIIFSNYNNIFCKKNINMHNSLIDNLVVSSLDCLYLLMQNKYKNINRSICRIANLNRKVKINKQYYN